MDPAELLSGLSRPDAFPEAGPTVEVVQTHISIVFLTGARAYKVKKTLSLWGFLDYSTLEARRVLCEAEVRLNRRLAPETYLGVLPIVRRAGRLFVGGDGEVVDHAVVMERLAPGATLAERIAAGRAGPDDVRAIAALLRRFHAETAGGAEARRVGAPPAFETIVRQNVSATEAAVPDVFPAPVHAWLRARLEALIRATRPLLERRAADGVLVEGHGDLRAEHCVLWREAQPHEPSAWRVIDAIEFTPLLRCIDPLSDAAFLAMDLASLDRPDLARAFTDGLPRSRARRGCPRALAAVPRLPGPRAREGRRPPGHGARVPRRGPRRGPGGCPAPSGARLRRSRTRGFRLRSSSSRAPPAGARASSHGPSRRRSTRRSWPAIASARSSPVSAPRSA